MASLDHLWAGWRSELINSSTAAPAGGPDEAQRESACVFCAMLASGLADEETHIVWRHPEGRVFVVLNAYPYTSGHLMAMPTRHAGDLDDLSPAESADLWQAVTLGIRALKVAYRPDGVNIGANLGRAAGAGVPGHVHVHVLGRWAGDTNFMTSVADARVLPEPLGESAARIRSAWPGPGATGEHPGATGEHP